MGKIKQGFKRPPKEIVLTKNTSKNFLNFENGQKLETWMVTKEQLIIKQDKNLTTKDNMRSYNALIQHCLGAGATHDYDA